MPGEPRQVSFRDQIGGALADFCESEGLTPLAPRSALVQLVASLAAYREEGLPLFPEVFVCADANRMHAMLQGGELVRLGSGPFREDTIRRALKQCAPLATGAWAVFLEPTATTWNYGIFTPMNLPLSLSSTELLIDGGDPTFPVIVASQIAENVVEVRGTAGGWLQICFSAVRDTEPPPLQPVDDLIAATTANIREPLTAPTRRFLKRVFTTLLPRTRGTLIAVVSSRRVRPPRCMCSGVLLNTPISLLERIAAYHQRQDAEGMSRLLSFGNLIAGMITCDGITIFRSDASVLGYNVILRNRSILGEGPVGGARHETFEALARMVPTKLNAAFIRSHDGHMACRY